MGSEIKRKLFHLAGLIYVSGFVFLRRPIFLILMGMVVVLIFGLEMGRFKSKNFNGWIQRYFGGLFRSAEKDHFTGAFWMALGVFLTGIFPLPACAIITCILYLIFGDTAAGLIGKRFGQTKWPYSEKSLIGSSACFLICFLLGAFLLHETYGWGAILTSALGVTILESLSLKINDNLLLPVGSALILLAF